MVLVVPALPSGEEARKGQAQAEQEQRSATPNRGERGHEPMAQRQVIESPTLSSMMRAVMDADASENSRREVAALRAVRAQLPAVASPPPPVSRASALIQQASRAVIAPAPPAGSVAASKTLRSYE